MRILIGWDDEAEAELISLYLNAGENEAVSTTRLEELPKRVASDDGFDIVLMSTGGPNADFAFQIFRKLRHSHPLCPIVVACRSEDMIGLARFIRAGMRTYVVRDLGGDFVFLLLATLESTYEAMQAEREQLVAEQMREEIESVRRFQDAVISQNLFSPPGYQVAGRYESSQIRVVGGKPVVLAGGDYYDVISLDKTRTAFVVGDAAGHGMRACMSITIMQTLLETLGELRFRKTSDFVKEINRRFCDQKIVRRDGSLVTLLYCVFRHDRHELQWTTAGHPIPILHDRLKATVEQVAESAVVAGPPLGVDSDIKYESFTTRIPPGGRLLLYSDGLVEASPDENSGRQFGLNGVRRTLFRSTDRRLEQTVQALMDDSEEFTRGRGRHDDTSAVLVERL